MKRIHLIETKYGTWKARIWHDSKDKAYLVEVPSFNSAATYGNTLAHAKAMAADLIEGLCEVAFGKGQAVVDDLRRLSGRGKIAHLS